MEGIVRPIDATIISKVHESPTIGTIVLDKSVCPAPGQYAMIWVRGVDEIPMSFSGQKQITVQAVGDATRALLSLRPGERIGLRGPLGNGFQLRGNSILLIGGGVGVAPLAFLGEEAKRRGINVTSLIGFRSLEDMIFLDRFEQLGRTIITTDDGSVGVHGRAAEGLKELNLDEFGQIYLCGPELMMWDIICRADGHATRIQASINRHFKCAVGVCGACCLDPEGIRVCVEGPVIAADRLLKSEFGRYRRDASGGKGPCRG
jgi:dihydroorotate dehydrogenase electron transfer subunit